MTAHRATLEEAYMELTRDAVEYRAESGRAGRAVTAPATTPSRPAARPGWTGFAHLLRAEWTKFRTVRGWVIAVLVAVLLTLSARPVQR